MTTTRRLLALAVVVVLPALAGCAVKKEIRDSARDVLTLRRGTISGLRALRFTGPFQRYEVPPDEMLDVAADACRMAKDLAGREVKLRVSRRYREVVAKEHGPEAPPDPAYDEEWRTAVVVTVHPIEGEPEAARVEFHAARRSVLMGGVNDWERSLPGWIDEVLRERARGGDGVPGVKPLPTSVDLSASGARFLAKWNEVSALRDAVPPPPVPPADKTDVARMTTYRADLAAYARAADAYRSAMEDFRGIAFAHEWKRLEPATTP